MQQSGTALLVENPTAAEDKAGERTVKASGRPIQNEAGRTSRNSRSVRRDDSRPLSLPLVVLTAPTERRTVRKGSGIHGMFRPRINGLYE